jgi:hypothetical protein
MDIHVKEDVSLFEMRSSGTPPLTTIGAAWTVKEQSVHSSTIADVSCIAEGRVEGSGEK